MKKTVYWERRPNVGNVHKAERDAKLTNCGLATNLLIPARRPPLNRRCPVCYPNREPAT